MSAAAIGAGITDTASGCAADGAHAGVTAEAKTSKHAAPASVPVRTATDERVGVPWRTSRLDQWPAVWNATAVMTRMLRSATMGAVAARYLPERKYHGTPSHTLVQNDMIWVGRELRDVADGRGDQVVIRCAIVIPAEPAIARINTDCTD